MGKIVPMKIPQSILSVDVQQAAFWGAPMSRAEAQKVFQDYTEATVGMQERIIKLDFAVSFLLERFNVTPDDITAFMEKKVKEFAAKQPQVAESETI